MNHPLSSEYKRRLQIHKFHSSDPVENCSTGYVIKDCKELIDRPKIRSGLLLMNLNTGMFDFATLIVS